MNGAERQEAGASPLGALLAALFGLAGSAGAAIAAFRAGGPAAPQRVPSPAATLAAGVLPLAFGLGAAAFEARRAPGRLLRNFASVLRLPRSPGAALRHATAGLAAGLCSVLPLLWTTAAAQRILEPLGFRETMQDSMRWMLDGGATAAQTFALAAVAFALAPLGEEVLYRALLLGGLERAWGRSAAFVYSAAFFAALHLHLSFLPALFVLALALGLAWRRLSIAFAAAMHAGFNIGNIAIAILLQYDPGPAFLLH